MKLIFRLVYIGCRHLFISAKHIFHTLITKFVLFGNNVDFKTFITYGIPLVKVSRINGIFVIGENFCMNNGLHGNQIGYNTPCVFCVKDNARLIIGDNVGMSQVAIVCHKEIEIGNNVKLGGGVKIYDSDFHSVNYLYRKNPLLDVCNSKVKPVKIGNDVFIGAGSIILKGTTIGDRSIVAAGSVVVKDIPSNQLWGGNPAKFLKNI